MQITQAGLGNLKEVMPSAGKVAWVGASSFEERCYGSLEALVIAGIPLTAVLRIDYKLGRDPTGEAAARRNKWLDKMASLVKYAGVEFPVTLDVSARTATEFERLLVEFITEHTWDADLLIVDISCLTKLHTILTAAGIAQIPDVSKIAVAYTLPQNYSGMAENHPRFDGYDHTVVAPVVSSAVLRSESRGRGIILIGHEDKRLNVAMAELEPPGGVVVRASTSYRPDFAQRTNSRNRQFLTRLGSLGSWDRVDVMLDDIANFSRIVRHEVGRAQTENGPVVLYPFGPKPFVLCAAHIAALEYPSGSWFVYPSPSFYDPFATQGVGRTYWGRFEDIPGQHELAREPLNKRPARREH